jgi:hypothetical protein
MIDLKAMFYETYVETIYNNYYIVIGLQYSKDNNLYVRILNLGEKIWYGNWWSAKGDQYNLLRKNIPLEILKEVDRLAVKIKKLKTFI